MSDLKKRDSTWTYDPEAHAYYFKPDNRTPPPYVKQTIVEAIVDVASDGSFAGIEIIDSKMPKPKERSYWICGDCGNKHGKHNGHASTLHLGECGWCQKKDVYVTEPRDYGHPKRIGDD